MDFLEQVRIAADDLLDPHVMSGAWQRAASPTHGPSCGAEARSGQTGGMTKGQQLLEDLEQQRRAGDPRLTASDRAILERVTTGDLADELADALALAEVDDPVLGGDDPGN
ncbi:MAG TPA: hypothetical protein VF228_22625 [Iamia sp.]